jgi:hypothetical protein
LRNIKAIAAGHCHQGALSRVDPMATPTSRSGRVEKATRADLHHFLGDMDDETAVAILGLEPSVAQVEEACIWLSGDDEALAQERPPDAVVAQILELIVIDDEEPPPSPK